MPSIYPHLPVFSKSSKFNLIELTKSVIFIAFLQVSFKHKARITIVSNSMNGVTKEEGDKNIIEK